MIGHEDDGLPVGGNLHRTGDHASGDDLRRAAMGQARPLQAVAHAVGGGADNVLAAEKGGQRLGGEVVVLGAGDSAHGGHFGVRWPGLWGQPLASQSQEVGWGAANGQDVARPQRPPLVAAEAAAEVGGAGAQDRRHGDATSDGQVGPRPRALTSKVQHRPSPHEDRQPHGQRPPVDHRLQIAPGHGHQAVVAGL